MIRAQGARGTFFTCPLIYSTVLNYRSFKFFSKTSIQQVIHIYMRYWATIFVPELLSSNRRSNPTNEVLLPPPGQLRPKDHGPHRQQTRRSAPTTPHARTAIPRLARLASILSIDPSLPHSAFSLLPFPKIQSTENPRS